MARRRTTRTAKRHGGPVMPPPEEAAPAITLNEELQLPLMAALLRDERYVGVQGGWGSGKTAGLVFAMLYWAESEPGSVILALTDTGGRLRDVLEPEIRKWLEPMGWRWNMTERRWVCQTTGSEIWLRSYYRPATRSTSHNPLEGINAHKAVIDECQTLRPEVLQKVIARTRRSPTPQFVLSGLPTPGAWWMRTAEDKGAAIHATSFANEANLPKAWFEALEDLPPDQYQAMVLNQPQALVGGVYSAWKSEPWPNGNLAPADWAYDGEAMSGYLAADWGLNKPSVLIFAHDETLPADVLVAELNPTELTLEQLTAEILAVGWPRHLQGSAPGPRIWLDAGCGDKAGRARSDRTLRSTFDELRQAPPLGLGLNLRSTTDPRKVDLLNGIACVQRLICHRGERRLLVAQDVWAESLAKRRGNSFARSLQSYRWAEEKSDGRRVPVKDGREDPVDAARYHAVAWHWHAPSPPSFLRQVRDQLPEWHDVVAGDR